MKFKGQYWRALLVFVGALLLFDFSMPAYAQSSYDNNQDTTVAAQECTSQINSDNSGSLAPLPRDTYSIYLQLAKRGQYANVKLSAIDSENGSCQTIGETKTTGDGWTKAGSWQMTANPEAGATFLLESDELNTTIDANRPAIMLVSESNPTCTPNPTCQVVVMGHTGTILPLSNSIASNGLLVTRVVPPETDTIRQVINYVNERQMYTTDTFEPFDLRYVTHSQERTVSVIEYASGQRISIVQMTPSSHSDTFFHFLFRLYQKNPALILTISISVAIWLIGALLFSLVRAWERRYYWRLAHGFIKQKASLKIASHFSDLEYSRRIRIKSVVAKSFTVISLLLFVIIVSVAFNRYVTTFYSVSGASMESTYRDANKVFVNRIPVTLAQLANRTYIPKRGEVVILHANYGPAQPYEQEKNTQNDFIIKRVIGLPGERVMVINGTITVRKTDGTIIRPDDNSSWQYNLIADERVENIDLTLTEDELFVIGDNRPESLDSRFNGAINVDQLTGTVTGKIW